MAEKTYKFRVERDESVGDDLPAWPDVDVVCTIEGAMNLDKMLPPTYTVVAIDLEFPGWGPPPEPPREYFDKSGKRRTCRLDPSKLEEFHDDPITQAYGVPSADFINDWRKRDLRDGCPFCLAEAAENASEPDVLRRWEIR